MDVNFSLAAVIKSMLNLFEHALLFQWVKSAVNCLIELKQLFLGANPAAESGKGLFGLKLLSCEFGNCRLCRRGPSLWWLAAAP